jgi:hypothetical protein
MIFYLPSPFKGVQTGDMGYKRVEDIGYTFFLIIVRKSTVCIL